MRWFRILSQPNLLHLDSASQLELNMTQDFSLDHHFQL